MQGLPRDGRHCWQNFQSTVDDSNRHTNRQSSPISCAHTFDTRRAEPPELPGDLTGKSIIRGASFLNVSLRVPPSVFGFSRLVLSSVFFFFNFSFFGGLSFTLTRLTLPELLLVCCAASERIGIILLAKMFVCELAGVFNDASDAVPTAALFWSPLSLAFSLTRPSPSAIPAAHRLSPSLANVRRALVD